MTRVALAVLAGATAAACSGLPEPAEVETVQSNLTGALTISGKLTTSTGTAIAGAKVVLAGKSEGTQTTTSSGTYLFSNLSSGSYSVRPTKASCALTPDVVNINNMTANKVQNFAGTGTGCAGAVVNKAVLLIDQRLYSRLGTEIDNYRTLAQTRRGFGIMLESIAGLDDWTAATTRSYVTGLRQANPAVEGVLYVGNVKLPSFYKTRNDIVLTRILPLYFMDLDATFQKTYADGAIDPVCNGTNDPNCVVAGGPVTVPRHDFDYVAKGPNPDPELWAAFMPVGGVGTNSYDDFANQLRPYLQKVASYYTGQLVSNGRFYGVSNDRGERFDTTWSAFGKDKIDFYGKAGPNGETDANCFVGGQNICYVRWATETYPSYAAFDADYTSKPWVGEGWQQDTIFISHMNANLYDVVQVNVHSADTVSLIGNTQAKALTKAGLLVGLDGCGVAGFGQPFSPSFVDDASTSVADNIMVSYLYGSSKTLATLGDPAWRGHYGNYPTIYQELKVNHSYLGLAHLQQLKVNYAAAPDAYNLKEMAMEMLIGDPFIDLR